jgi:tetratricopeptide (TPR) repeat protein
MNRKSAAICALLASALLVLPWTLSHASERGVCITEELQLKVADAFMEEGEYYRAVTEFKRFLILFPDSGRADYALLRTGTAYYEGEEYEQAVRSYSLLRRKYPSSTYAAKALYQEALSYWKSKQYERARAALDQFADSHPDSDFAPIAIIASSLAALDGEKIGLSRTRLDLFLARYPDHAASGKVEETLQLLAIYEQAPRKSRVLAGFMSAVVPGSGYFYAGQYGDGVMALLVNGLFIASTVIAFGADNSAAAAIMGGIGFPFYLGNIYGAARAADKWNIRVRREIRDRMFLTLDFAF